MKKIIPLLIVGVLLISGLGAVATPEGNVKQLSLSFSNLIIQETDEYSTLDLMGTNSVLMRKDHYMVPTQIETFTFPFGTKIKSVHCTPKNIHKHSLTKDLMITPEPVIFGETLEDVHTQRNADPIALNSWYEYDVGTGLNGNDRVVIVKVQTFPVQYHPLENILEWVDKIEIEIQYEKPEQPVIFGDSYTFVILGPEEYSSGLSPLVTHKTGNGISTIFVSLDEVYDSTYFPVEGRDNPEKIKYFIKNAIENWGTSFVMLVGSSLKFPVRITHVHIKDDPLYGEEEFVSDLYYADIYDENGNFSSWDSNENDVFGEYDWGPSHNYDDVDLEPDVYLGRLACRNSGEVTTLVNKIKTYENNQAYQQNWFSNIVLVGGDSFIGDSKAIDEGEYINQKVIDIMDGFIPDKQWASNGKLTSLVPTGVANIKSAINAGCGFVDFSGHGNPQVWATHPHNSTLWIPTPGGNIKNTDIQTLSNGDELPIVTVEACSTSKFNNDPNCFNWAFMHNSNGGAIGTFGATGIGYGYIGEYVSQGLIGKIGLDTFRAYRDDGAITFGEMWAKALGNYIKPTMNDGDHKTVEEWQPFGDPTLVIGEESDPPATPDAPEGPESGNVNDEHTYTASTTDPNGDEIYYLFSWGDGEYSGWVGPYKSGETGNAKHKWAEKGTYEIMVKAKDEHGVQSEWSDPLIVSMPKSKALFNPIILEFLKSLIERFPLLEQILLSRPIIGGLLDL
jgi:hypothetical protein